MTSQGRFDVTKMWIGHWEEFLLGVFSNKPFFNHLQQSVGLQFLSTFSSFVFLFCIPSHLYTFLLIIFLINTVIFTGMTLFLLVTYVSLRRQRRRNRQKVAQVGFAVGTFMSVKRSRNADFIMKGSGN